MTIEVGQTYWLVNRERVRAGKGPRKVTVTELGHTTQGGVRSVTFVWCGKHLANVSELHADEHAAKKAHMALVDREWALEKERKELIFGRLRKAWEAGR